MRLQSNGRRAGTSAAVVAVLLTGSAGAAGAAPPAEPPLRLVAAAQSVTLDRYEDYGVLLDLGTHIVAGAHPFEVRAKRSAYRNPIVATQIVRTGTGQRSVRLPTGLVTQFSGFTDFTRVVLKDASGATVLEQQQDFCPNTWRPVRTRPDAPDTSPYPRECPYNPFTVGSVWGLQAGWAAPSSQFRGGEPVDLPVGRYTAEVTVDPAYRDLFGIPVGQAAATVAVTVRPYVEGHAAARPRLRSAAQPAAAQPAAPRPAAAPAASRPTGPVGAPAGPRPDLRTLPAFNVSVLDPDEEPGGPPVTGDYLAFSATVWTAGDSPLVVDGFRRPGADVMDAYQYFYDTAGKQTGYAPVGTMEWDERDGHHHWHFTDFAQYRLLDATRKVAVRSEKEAFCLANTDAVDYTLAKANWQPDNTDLHTACGSQGSLAVREVLDVGSGDTYSQYLPGQSFDLAGLPNGTYYIEVTANPDGKLHEARTDNNVALRRVILGGVPGARTVDVPPHEGIEG